MSTVRKSSSTSRLKATTAIACRADTKPAFCERSSAGSGDADAIAPDTAQFAVKQVVGSTKTITVADQLHLSRFAGDISGHYRGCRGAAKISKRHLVV